LNPARYSYSWAASVVERLKEKYARATDHVETILDITDRDLANFLARGDPVFPQLREFIHIMDNWDRTSQRPDHYLTDVNQISSYIRRKGWERLANRLDEIGIRDRIKEQGSRGGAE
jgi:hypothetical protein